MTFTNHVLTGALIAVSITNPWIALPLCFAAHFAIDALPHFGLKSRGVTFFSFLALDAVIGLTAFGWLVLHFNPFLVAAGAGLCVLPDLQWLPQLLGGRIYFERIYRFHKRIQWAERSYGWIYELIWATLMIAALRSVTVLT